MTHERDANEALALAAHRRIGVRASYRITYTPPPRPSPAWWARVLRNVWRFL